MFTCQSCSRRVIRALLSASAGEHAAVSRPRHSKVSFPNTKKSAFATAAKKPLRGNSHKSTPKQNVGGDIGYSVNARTYRAADATALEENLRIRKFQSSSSDYVRTHRGAGATALKEHSRARRVQASSSDYVPSSSLDTSIWDNKTPIDLTKIKRHAKLELQHIREPYRLAERCLAILSSGDFDLAVNLVRRAGGAGMDTTVSWNHIINTTTKAGHLTKAYALFQEMKKRGQKPDSYTYSILLRGYSNQTPLSKADLDRARKIYYPLYLPSSPVKPKIIHGNIMLEICARAEALDLMFEIASKLSERGSNSPDQITYTTIFNALSNAKLHNKEDKLEIRTELISQARRIWEDVIEKWKSGSMLLGEELVCSMGRVLLTSPLIGDHDSVFTLLEQGMRIPRQTNHISDSPKPSVEVEAKMPGQRHFDVLPQIENLDMQDISNAIAETAEGEQSTANSDPNSSSELHLHTELKGNSSATTSGDFSSRQMLESRRSVDSSSIARLVYTKPGNKTLSLLLATCAKLHLYKIAGKYWTLLTNQCTPDTFNFIEYMRILKISANSSAATTVLKEAYQLSRNRNSTIQLHPAMWEHGMTTCHRTNDSKIALRNATRILIMLQMSTVEPSFSVIEIFTKILAKPDTRFPVEDVMRAAETLMMVFGNFKSLFAFGRTDSNGPPSASEDLGKTIHEIDRKWQPVAKPAFRLSMSRTSVLTEMRSQLSMEERKGIRQLGRRIEIALSMIIKIYSDSMSRDQIARLRSDLYRVRSWVFPRNQDLLNEIKEEDIAQKMHQKSRDAANPARLGHSKHQFAKDLHQQSGLESNAQITRSAVV